MDGNLTITYNKASDTLYLDRVPPYAEQESDDIGDSIFARFNPDTEEIETLEVMSFRARIRGGQTLRLPLTAAFWLVERPSLADQSAG